MAETVGRLTGRRLGKSFGLAATYVGTVIGAGFASGQEIWTFFARFGPAGLIGLALAGTLFAVIGTRALTLGAGNRPGDTYYQILQHLFGPLAPCFDLILLVFLVVLSGVMLAGAGALSELAGWPFWLGVLGTALLSLVVVGADVPGLIVLNKLIVPFLVLIVSGVALATLTQRPTAIPPAPRSGWLPASLLYVSYNTVLSLPVLIALGASEPDPGIRRAGGLLGAAGLTLLGTLILISLRRNPYTARAAEMPMAAVAFRLGRPAVLVYSVILWAELFTTLVADAYGAAVRLSQLWGGARTSWAGAVMASGILLSRLGFANLVRTAYPAFGLICLVILARLLWPARPRPARWRPPSHDAEK